MNRNQKIALGCGGASCLGVIAVLIVAVILGVAGYLTVPGVSSYNSNRNSNYNSNTDQNSNSNSNAEPNSNSNTSSSSSTMSDDDKHKLLQAAGMANDSEMMPRVLRKLGFITDSGVSDDYAQFIKDHASWAQRNIAFINSMRNQEKAREYVNEHIND
jgi:hypothetical protein